MEDYTGKYKATLNKEKENWENTIEKVGSPTEADCRLALEYLGTLTHMWQDYYGHGVKYDPNLHPDDSPKRDFSIGEIEGDPENIAMEPVSYGWFGFAGKHGGIWRVVNPFSKVEPGDPVQRTEKKESVRRVISPMAKLPR